MTMVVVHLTASRFFGGPERQMLELAKALPTEIRSVFVSFSETGLCQAFLDKVRQDGFEAIALRYDTPRLLAALRELVGVLRSLRTEAGKGDRSILPERPSGCCAQNGPVPFSGLVLCCHGYKAGLLGLVAARRIGIPAIAVSRGWTGENFKVRIYEALDRRVLRWMDKVVCVSEGQAAKVRRAGVRDDKITVIHNAIRPERFENPDPAYREQLRRMFGAEKWSVVSGQWSEQGGKGDRSILPERPSGCCAQNGPVPFSGP
ncbi:MAG: glycosyltransferase, partial [Pirellulales bacterium]|nr:glycosyltransferase [Pirellulales bacterium]